MSAAGYPKAINHDINCSHHVAEKGKLFGSIGARDIANVVTAAGVDLSKSEVRLPEGVLRHTGEFDVAVQVHPEVTATVKLTIAGEA